MIDLRITSLGCMAMLGACADATDEVADAGPQAVLDCTQRWSILHEETIPFRSSVAVENGALHMQIHRTALYLGVRHTARLEGDFQVDVEQSVPIQIPEAKGNLRLQVSGPLSPAGSTGFYFSAAYLQAVGLWTRVKVEAMVPDCGSECTRGLDEVAVPEGVEDSVVSVERTGNTIDVRASAGGSIAQVVGTHPDLGTLPLTLEIMLQATHDYSVDGDPPPAHAFVRELRSTAAGLPPDPFDCDTVIPIDSP